MPLEEFPIIPVTTEEGLNKCLDHMDKYTVIGCDTETEGLDPHTCLPRLLQMTNQDYAYVVDLWAFSQGDVHEGGIPRLPKLCEFLSNPTRLKLMHNGKFDIKFISKHLGIEPSPIFDTWATSIVLNCSDQTKPNDLGHVAARYARVQLDKSLQVSDWGGPLSKEQLLYAAEDAMVLHPIWEKQRQRLKEEGLTHIAWIENQAVPAFAAMELAGIALDTEAWAVEIEKMKEDYERTNLKIQKEFNSVVDQSSLFDTNVVNLESAGEVRKALARLGIPLPEGTQKLILETIRSDHPIIDYLLDYREAQKILSSYSIKMMQAVNAVTGRIHADFNQLGAQNTGRTSCKNPNMQQLPHGENWRDCIYAPEGRILVTADYSQFELRILAEFSQEPLMLKAFREKIDLHKMTGHLVFNTAIDEVSKQQRDIAKRANFGTVYGIAPMRLSRLCKISFEFASEVLDAYFHNYTYVDKWLKWAKFRAQYDKISTTLAGRKIKYQYDPEDEKVKAGVGRNGMNAPIQGSNADIAKRAMYLIHTALRGTTATLINFVHDEFVIECDEQDANDVGQLLVDCMKQAAYEYIKTVPIEVDFFAHKKWRKE